MALTENDLQAISALLQPIREDISDLKEDVSGLKEDVAVLKEDVSGLKEDVAVLKEDVSGLKKDVDALKENVSHLEDETTLIKLKLENVIEPKIGLLAENYVPAAKKFEAESRNMEDMRTDIVLLKQVVSEHSKKLQRIS